MTNEAGGSGGVAEIDRVPVVSRDGDYEVLVGRGLLTEVPALVRTRTGADRVAVISDDNVGPLHGERLASACRSGGLEVAYLTFEAGEASKSRDSWTILTDRMLEEGLGRDTVVVAVGGGVTTDLAGFVAATYLRGVPVVQVPTSYLAMIDASVGGKTGVDVRAGKNLVGAFHSPAVVVVDTDVLETLPARERAQGLVEAFKHGAIADAGYFAELTRRREELLDADPDAARAAVLRSVSIKATVVGQDEFEAGYRQVLNFGHTLAHAIEAASGYAVGHGTAVALGMIAEADLGEGAGITEPGTRDVLASALAPLLDGVEVDVDAHEAMGYLGVDKKSRAGEPRFVLLAEIGRVHSEGGWAHAVPPTEAATALERVLDGRGR